MRAKVVQLKEIITYTPQSPAARQGTARQAFALETCCVAEAAAASAAAAAAAQLAGGLTTADTVRSSINRSSGAQKCSASAR